MRRLARSPRCGFRAGAPALLLAAAAAIAATLPRAAHVRATPTTAATTTATGGDSGGDNGGGGAIAIAVAAAVVLCTVGVCVALVARRRGMLGGPGDRGGGDARDSLAYPVFGDEEGDANFDGLGFQSFDAGAQSSTPAQTQQASQTAPRHVSPRVVVDPVSRTTRQRPARTRRRIAVPGRRARTTHTCRCARCCCRRSPGPNPPASSPTRQ